ncbi:MAG: PAS domain S-box protein, partial [Rhodoglobus sp.]|nr:PAS domain S-box protein [Rhodoglobus sp.]
MEGATGRCEFAVLGLKGTPRWLETHAVPYRNVQRKIVGVLGITRDVTLRRQAAIELERGFSTLHTFINTVPAYISVVDAHERYLLVNRRYEDYFGLPASRLVGRRVEEVQPAAAYAEMVPHIRTVLGGQTVRYQSNPKGPDGRSYWFDVQYVPRRGDDGAVTGFFVLVFDVSATKEIEEALRDSRSRLDSILNSMADVVWSTTPDGRTLNFVSASAQAVYGRPAADFMADAGTWLAMVHPEDRAAAEQTMGRVSEIGVFDLEYRIIRRDGAVRWVHDRGRIVNDADGRPLRLDGIVTDITERRLADERFRKLIEHAPEAIQILDVGTGKFLHVNSATERLFKRSADELGQIGPTDVSPP